MDSLDLTFVRCPSCRSLVPAISTRCRMCGASLEATASSESHAGATEKSALGLTSTSGSSGISGTSSVSSSEGMTAKSENAGGNNERSGVMKFDDGKKASDSEDSVDAVTGEDPLSAYVEELTTASPSASDNEASVDAVGAFGSTAGASTSGASALGETTGATSSIGSAALESQASSVMAASSSEDTADAATSGTVSMGRADASSRGDSGKADRSRQPFEARRNSSERRYQQPSAQGSGSNQGSKEQSNLTNNRRSDMKGSESNRGEASRGVDLRRNDGRGAPASSGSAALARTPSVVATPGAVVRPRENQVFGSGRLVGWLVSYADTRGASLELREGKFFVTAKSIKENDLVLDDRSVSTPHALVGCGLDGTLTVQDLMSERGVFVRRRGSNQYRQEEEAIPVEHGDWLRFGDLEFLVVLIPAGME